MSSKVLAVIQPSFLPWRGYFQIIASSDLFVLYDDVQYDKHGWRNRNRIKVADDLSWITIPVLSKGKFGQLNRDVKIDQSTPWRRKILGSIRSAYAKAPFYSEVYPWIERRLTESSDFLVDLDETLTRDICGFLNIVTPIRRSSELQLVAEDPVDRLIELCVKTDSNHYLSGPSASAYIDPERFTASSISLSYVDYSTLPEYTQAGSRFEPSVSILDALMSHGPNAWKTIFPAHAAATHESQI